MLYFGKLFKCSIALTKCCISYYFRHKIRTAPFEDTQMLAEKFRSQGSVFLDDIVGNIKTTSGIELLLTLDQEFAYITEKSSMETRVKMLYTTREGNFLISCFTLKNYIFIICQPFEGRSHLHIGTQGEFPSAWGIAISKDLTGLRDHISYWHYFRLTFCPIFT